MVFMLVMAGSVMAKEMVIEEGTVFTDSFTKDGRRVEVSKTYTWDGVVIHQRIYNADTGELIRERTTTNPLRDHVRLVPRGGAVEAQQETKVETQNVQVEKKTEVRQQKEAVSVTDKTGVDEVVEPTPAMNLVEARMNLSDLNRAEVSVEAVDRVLDPEALADRAKERHGFDKVGTVYVSQGLERAQASMEVAKTKRFLGLFQVEIPTRLTVDAQTGEIIGEEKPLRARLLSWLSI